MSKLTSKQKIEIYNKRKARYAYSELTLEYGLNRYKLFYLVLLIDKHGFDILRNNSKKHYSEEFKEGAIKRVLNDGESMASIRFFKRWYAFYLD